MIDEAQEGNGRRSWSGREGWIHAVGLAAALFGIVYLVWRVGWTIGGAALWLAVPMFVPVIGVPLKSTDAFEFGSVEFVGPFQ